MHQSILSPHKIDDYLDALGPLSDIERSAQALRCAAKCVEFAAFSGAEDRRADEIGALIQIAARLEALANDWAARPN